MAIYSDGWQVIGLLTLEDEEWHGNYKRVSQSTMKALSDILGYKLKTLTLDLWGEELDYYVLEYGSNNLWMYAENSSISSDYIGIRFGIINDNGTSIRHLIGSSMQQGNWILSVHNKSENSAKVIGFNQNRSYSVVLADGKEMQSGSDIKTIVFPSTVVYTIDADAIKQEYYSMKQIKNFILDPGGYISLASFFATVDDKAIKMKNLYYSVADYSSIEKVVQIKGQKFQSIGTTNFYVPL